jgi:hypothetical protein
VVSGMAWVSRCRGLRDIMVWMMSQARGGRRHYGLGDSMGRWRHGLRNARGAQRHRLKEDDVVVGSGMAS